MKCESLQKYFYGTQSVREHRLQYVGSGLNKQHRSSLHIYYYIYIYIYIYIWQPKEKLSKKKIGHVHNDTRRHFQALAHLCFTISLTV